MIEKELVYKYPSSLIPLRDDSKANGLHLFQDFPYMIKLRSPIVVPIMHPLLDTFPSLSQFPDRLPVFPVNIVLAKLLSLQF